MGHECAENTKTNSQNTQTQCRVHSTQTEPCLTRMMMRMAAVPDVAITLAQLGMRLKSTGTIPSAP